MNRLCARVLCAGVLGLVMSCEPAEEAAMEDTMDEPAAETMDEPADEMGEPPAAPSEQPEDTGETGAGEPLRPEAQPDTVDINRE